MSHALDTPYRFLCLIHRTWLKTWQRFPFPQGPGAERKRVIREQLTLLEAEEKDSFYNEETRAVILLVKYVGSEGRCFLVPTKPFYKTEGCRRRLSLERWTVLQGVAELRLDSLPSQRPSCLCRLRILGRVLFTTKYLHTSQQIHLMLNQRNSSVPSLDEKLAVLLTSTCSPCRPLPSWKINSLNIVDQVV